ncbi:MAG: type II toxin-antitoxin system ParD family antitoxin [Parvularculaceae bacterium]
MSITLSPEKQAFIRREIAAGGFKSESEAVERALTLYERHLRRIREAIAEAEREIAEGCGVTLSADQHLAQIHANAAKNR